MSDDLAPQPLPARDAKGFPRLRRLRRTDGIRRMVCETTLSSHDLIAPLFVLPGHGAEEEISSLPGQCRYSVDRLPPVLSRLQAAGVPGVLLFGLPAHKDHQGSEAWDDNGAAQRATRLIKRDFPDLCVFTDLCLCPFTSHGHCGVLNGQEIDNDATLPLLAKAALSLAHAGADFIAPSDMMDGRVAAIRNALDAAGMEMTGILSYSTKFASAFYGPFREAAHSAPAFGDRRGYQMDPANAREAVRESLQDEAEGADMLMVKPALAFLDVIRAVREATRLPLACYNVSGEYAMVKAAAERGWIDERRVVLESLIGMKRAGADLIITYHALDAAGWL